MDKSKVIVCRCEDVTLKDIEECIDAGLTSLEEVNRYLKCSMGTCQGRGCSALVEALISGKVNGTKKRPPSIRPPLLPLDVSSFRDDE